MPEEKLHINMKKIFTLVCNIWFKNAFSSFKIQDILAGLGRARTEKTEALCLSAAFSQL